MTRTGYNEQIRLDLGARYIRSLLYIKRVAAYYWLDRKIEVEQLERNGTKPRTPVIFRRKL